MVIKFVLRIFFSLSPRNYATRAIVFIISRGGSPPAAAAACEHHVFIETYLICMTTFVRLPVLLAINSRLRVSRGPNGVFFSIIHSFRLLSTLSRVAN